MKTSKLAQNRFGLGFLHLARQPCSPHYDNAINAGAAAVAATLARRPGRREAGTERELGVATALVDRVELTAQLVRVLPDRVQLGRGLGLGLRRLALRVGADTSQSNSEFECAARVDTWNARQRGVAALSGVRRT